MTCNPLIILVANQGLAIGVAKAFLRLALRLLHDFRIAGLGNSCMIGSDP